MDSIKIPNALHISFLFCVLIFPHHWKASSESTLFTARNSGILSIDKDILKIAGEVEKGRCSRVDMA